MSGVDRVLRPVDLAQQRRAWLALPVAAARKFGEDSAGNLAALLAYYAFAAIFPLLLTFSTIVGYILDSRSGLRRELLDSAVVDFPVIRDQLRTTGLQGHWYVIVISLAISLWGARGVAGAAQAALNAVWNVPYAQRPGFPAAAGRSFALLAVAAFAVLSTGLLSGIGGTGSILGAAARVLAYAASTLINVGVFLLGFRLATAREVRLRDMARSAVASAVIWQVLLVAGTFLLAHQVRHAQELYGTFGVVLGLMTWLHLQGQLTLYAVEVDVVRAHRLWPRSLVQPPLTGGDKRAYRAYAEATRRRPASEQRVEVDFSDPVVPEEPTIGN
ncbi:YhjD/YihY/BrkB family envelope integrity protein [Rugosimonospora africana]|uniref:YhjD/YihY/BrkB family envelope integrity protein n=1 Tax=Rugosimonospora africana TaxID=556532 RepID=UPI0019407144|nr:YhjD/YihY/BrkB family envelope integrity protein [Rugosimonospora africana]